MDADIGFGFRISDSGWFEEMCGWGCGGRMVGGIGFGLIEGREEGGWWVVLGECGHSRGIIEIGALDDSKYLTVDNNS